MKSLEQTHICPNCGSEELRINNDTNDTRLCFKCGFTTSKLYAVNSDTLIGYQKQAGQLLNNLSLKDNKLNQYWFPIIIDIHKYAILYPQGAKDLWRWCISKYEAIPLFSRYNLPITHDTFQEYIVNPENPKNNIFFDSNDFYTALNILEKHEQY